jgi:hypothetical protein
MDCFDGFCRREFCFQVLICRINGDPESLTPLGPLVNEWIFILLSKNGFERARVAQRRILFPEGEEFARQV